MTMAETSAKDISPLISASLFRPADDKYQKIYGKSIVDGVFIYNSL
jgi:hypothetical protein